MANRLFPAWAHPSQEYLTALAQRLPNAITAMRSEQYRYRSTWWMLEEAHLAQIESVLKYPAHFWTRHVRRSKNGKETFVWSPTKRLRSLQLCAMMKFFPRATNHAVATAFGPGCSIIQNAKPHRSNRSSFRIDIQDAFPSIRTNHISAYLFRNGVDEDLAWVLARLWTYRGRLEQGAPVAPYIFNTMLEPLDNSLLAVLPEGYVYTRYGDDMCFSCPFDVFSAELEVALKSIVETHGFRINGKKTGHGCNGIIDLPGVVIKNGRIRPNGAYRKKIQETWRFLLPKQTQGHRSYVSSFGHSGDIRVLRPFIGERTKSRRQRQMEKIRRDMEREGCV